jgi:hypothetical protein
LSLHEEEWVVAAKSQTPKTRHPDGLDTIRFLVDCTTCSPLANDVKDYKPGKTADAGTKRKIKEYERASNIQQTDRSSISFLRWKHLAD